MATRDQLHPHVVHAIQKDGWTITHDPYVVPFAGTYTEIDLGAEKLIAAEDRIGDVMDKLERYRQVILDLIHEYQARVTGCEGLETYVAVDREGDHYQVLRDGWRNDYRFYGCVLHFDIKGGKIWIRHDGTEDAMAERLVERGVPREDIVLAFHAPFMRTYTEYAVG